MIRFENLNFDSIEKFDCRVVDLKHEGGGGLFTVIPISPLDYRKKHLREARAKIEIVKEQFETIFRITDDWGKLHIVAIDNIHKTGIENAIKAAKEQELLVNTNSESEA